MRLPAEAIDEIEGIDPDAVFVSIPAANLSSTQFEIALYPQPEGFLERAWSVFEGLWTPQTPGLWFVRKPPGLRVRGCGPTDAGWGRTAARLDALRDAGTIASWSTSVYEPESYRFGGPAGVEIVHAFLIASSRAWIEWATLRRRGDTRLDASLLALAIFDDLLRRWTHDRAERWDVWCRLSTLYFGLRPTPGAANLGPTQARDAAAAIETQAERALLSDMFLANERCTTALQAARASSELAIGPRTLASGLASFHWNIWCVGPARLRQLCESMTTALDPLGEAP